MSAEIDPISSLAFSISANKESMRSYSGPAFPGHLRFQQVGKLHWT
jgi:hypothetical protein